MSKVRLIIKETHQPPVDTPASIRWKTIVIENEELHDLLGDRDKKYDDREHKHSTFEVVGGEIEK